MIVRVIISRQLLAAFRKKTIAAYPNEYMETLWGRIEGGTVLVNSLKGVEHKASPERVEYEYGDALAPAGRGELFLGSIHSHPDSTDSTPSMADWESAFSSGEHVFGVMNICKKTKGFKTETSWWEPRPAIATVHPRVRRISTGTSSGSRNVPFVGEVIPTNAGDTLPNPTTPDISGTSKTAMIGATHFNRPLPSPKKDTEKVEILCGQTPESS